MAVWSDKFQSRAKLTVRSNIQDPAIVMLVSFRPELDLASSCTLEMNAHVVKLVGFAGFTAAKYQVGAFWWRQRLRAI